MLKKRKKILSIIFVLGFLCISPKSNSIVFNKPAPNLQSQDVWVDSLLNTMSLNQKICQLMMIRGHSDKTPQYEQDVANLIKTYKVGGICFFQGTPGKQAILTNYYQSLSDIPLMIGMDAEWGLGMRLTDSVMSFPKSLTLGAIKNDGLIKEMGKEIASQLKRLGVHINFAPVADINNNAENPVINVRSFGENRENVALKATAYMKGLQENGIMACAKHFPGHGDTNIDSHYDLPVLSQSISRLDSLELFPFKTLISQGIQSVMVAHLNIPALEDKTNVPASLSPKAVNELLFNKMGFKGLVFTDGLEMKGVTKFFNPGEVEAEALVAGNDVLLLPESVPAALQTINSYIQQGKLTEKIINERVKKVLTAKFKFGLSNYKPIELFNLKDDLNSQGAMSLKRTLVENALTLVRNQSEKLPLTDIENLKILSVAVGAKSAQTFQNTIGKYIKSEFFAFSENDDDDKKRQILNHCKKKDFVLLSVHGLNNNAKSRYGLSNNELSLINDISSVSKVILVNFGTPYLLKNYDQIPYVLQAYEDSNDFQDLAAQVIFGGAICLGKLPVSSSFKSRYGLGLNLNKPIRLGFDIPERVGLSSLKLNALDLLANDAINIRATPGCQILVAKDGKIVFEKSFGYQGYDKLVPITSNSIYDIASITKVAATTISIMKLQEEGKINVEEPLSKYLDELSCTNKEYLLIRDIMAHKAGLRSWIPFYEKTMMLVNNRSFPSPEFYSNKRSKIFSIKVVDSLYLRKNYRDEIFDEIVKSELPNIGQYRYSDLGFYLLSEAITRITGTTIDKYAYNTFYGPLGLQTMGYRPLNRFHKSRLVPTEHDNYFRFRKIQGYVHDMGAAMLGGVSGHAGLFSNARDMAILMQMLLNKGVYGGKEYLNPQTIRMFTSKCDGCNRRGLGFDLGVTDKNTASNMSRLASDKTYGHTGFTGTCVWVDPEKNLVYVFLSNRTYPTMQNRKLIKEDYRERMHTAIYESLIL
jgi:beta-N-acetylhexosaminidase